MNRSRSGEWIALIGIVLLAIVLRGAAIFYVDALRLKPGESAAIAENLVEGNGFSFTEFGYMGPTSIRGPVYPLLLAGLDALLGTKRHAAQIAALSINVVFACGSVIVAFFLVRSWLGKNAGLIAATCFAIWPTQVYAAALMQGLCLGVLLTLATLLLMKLKNPGTGLLAGICAGLALLCEPILTIPLFLVALCVARHRASQAGLMLLAASMLIAPWLCRNAIVHDGLTGITDTFWADVFLGNGPQATGSEFLAAPALSDKPISQLDRLSASQRDTLKGQPETTRAKLFQEWSLQWMGAHPVDYARLCCVRVLKTFWLDWSHPLGLRWPNVLARTFALMGLIAAFFVKLPVCLKPALFCFAIGLTTATFFSLAEARTAVFMEIPQLIALSGVIANTCCRTTRKTAS